MKIPNLTWQVISRISSMPMVRKMYLWIFVVPIVANMLSHIETVVAVTVFSYTFKLQIELPFSWVAFYCSALFFVLAYTIYEIFCHAIVKENRCFSDFYKSKKGIEHLDLYMHEVGMNWEGARQSKEKRNDYFYEVANLADSSSQGSLQRDYFWVIFGRASSYRRPALIISATLYLAGILLITAVIFQSAYFVLLRCVGA